MHQKHGSKAVVLLSGGVDSATAAAMAIEEGFALHALSFRYGQRHEAELAAAVRVADALRIEHHVIQTIDLRVFGGSALTDDIDVPVNGTADEMEAGIPVTYVPARNTIFLACALGFAETINAFDIFIGANAVDYSGYPDCRPAFIKKFEELANLATAAAIEGRGRFSIHAPLIQLTKAEIVREGTRLGVDYGITHSCYAPTTKELACGRCDSCRLRAKGFREAGIADPTTYA